MLIRFIKVYFSFFNILGLINLTELMDFPCDYAFPCIFESSLEEVNNINERLSSIKYNDIDIEPFLLLE